jgi:hypothetical protein
VQCFFWGRRKLFLLVEAAAMPSARKNSCCLLQPGARVFCPDAIVFGPAATSCLLPLPGSRIEFGVVEMFSIRGREEKTKCFGTFSIRS